MAMGPADCGGSDDGFVYDSIFIAGIMLAIPAFLTGVITFCLGEALIYLPVGWWNMTPTEIGMHVRAVITALQSLPELTILDGLLQWGARMSHPILAGILCYAICWGIIVIIYVWKVHD